MKIHPRKWSGRIRKLKVRWTPELSQDLQAYYYFNPRSEKELIKELEKYIYDK